MNVQFVSNSKGKITAVQLPLKEWKEVEKKLEAFNLAANIKTSYREMEQVENGEIEVKMLEQFLNEL